MQDVIHFILHIDKHLIDLFSQYGTWIYAILFLIIFAETGFVVTPFLPGDSLLFAAGALAGIGNLSPLVLFLLLSAAAIIGNIVNYAIGYFVGDQIVQRGWIKEKYMTQTQAFYDKHGTKAIVISRFMPIIRTIAPFVAGLGKMEYKKFGFYNIIGGVAWVGFFVWLGYFVGQTEFVKNNFSLITLAIIGISLLPVLFAVAKEYLKKDTV
jgi:membrane-associated protein